MVYEHDFPAFAASGQRFLSWLALLVDLALPPVTIHLEIPGALVLLVLFVLLLRPPWRGGPS